MRFNKYAIGALFAVTVLVATALLAPLGHANDDGTEFATFAGGCFWCIEADFEKVEGVLSVVSGYTGGSVANPTYAQVSSGKTGHTEAVRVAFDPEIVSYEDLLAIFWRNIDPTVKNRQFCDVGKQYRTAIFYHDESQRQAAEKSRAALEKTKPFAVPIVTEITPAAEFYPAEDYHQDFAKKNPARYQSYRKGCKRDNRLSEIWDEKNEK
ncbi:MAG: peptide-methionine (S)-S-oxide reductase MsrA [Acidobacteria bacterium]|jgi:peptide-methionine (S)-S-oxide reductase|nr:peptide-methionine (S)-S-oxide reductase MsrA [Acidobacteriota bacterium]